MIIAIFVVEEITTGFLISAIKNVDWGITESCHVENTLPFQLQSWDGMVSSVQIWHFKNVGCHHHNTVIILALTFSRSNHPVDIAMALNPWICPNSEIGCNNTQMLWIYMWTRSVICTNCSLKLCEQGWINKLHFILGNLFQNVPDNSVTPSS